MTKKYMKAIMLCKVTLILLFSTFFNTEAFSFANTLGARQSSFSIDVPLQKSFTFPIQNKPILNSDIDEVFSNENRKRVGAFTAKFEVYNNAQDLAINNSSMFSSLYHVFTVYLSLNVWEVQDSLGGNKYIYQRDSVGGGIGVTKPQEGYLITSFSVLEDGSFEGSISWYSEKPVEALGDLNNSCPVDYAEQLKEECVTFSFSGQVALDENLKLSYVLSEDDRNDKNAAALSELFTESILGFTWRKSTIKRKLEGIIQLYL